MEIIAEFNISALISLNVYSYSDEIKYNDDLIISININHIDYFIGKDNIHGIIGDFSDVINSTITGENKITDKEIFSKGLGYYFNKNNWNINEELSDNKEESIFKEHNFFIWGNTNLSKNPLSSFLYEFENEFYIEVSDSYKWLFSEETEVNFVDFDIWVEEHFEVLLREKITIEKLNSFKYKCDELLSSYIDANS